MICVDVIALRLNIGGYIISGWRCEALRARITHTVRWECIIFGFVFGFVFGLARFACGRIRSYAIVYGRTIMPCISLFGVALVLRASLVIRRFCPIYIVRNKIKCDRLPSRKFLRLSGLAIFQQSPYKPTYLLI